MDCGLRDGAACRKAARMRTLLIPASCGLLLGMSFSAARLISPDGLRDTLRFRPSHALKAALWALGTAIAAVALLCWLAVMDIDHFKRINDSFGHIIGDEVLILLSQLMRDSFRLHDQLFRFGGEEFVAVLRTGSAEDTARILERFRERVAENAFPLVGQVTISIGYTLVDPLDTPTELVARADSALYYAKQNGRNLVACYEDLRTAGLIGGGQAKAAEIELF
jgi:diguanylate cyclase (GGDEF)-like protein